MQRRPSVWSSGDHSSVCPQDGATAQQLSPKPIMTELHQTNLMNPPSEKDSNFRLTERMDPIVYIFYPQFETVQGVSYQVNMRGGRGRFPIHQNKSPDQFV